MKILVADDSPTSLALISAALNMLGHEVTVTHSGQEAIDSFIKEKPDLIILDAMMLGIDGFECAKKIREIECDDWIPIIFLSGSIDDESVAKGINAGGDDYLTKPFSQVTLAAKIKAMQRISNMRKKLYDATCQLSLLSSTDTLTGLYNRLQFNNTILEKMAYAKRHNILLALLFIDLDNFKFVNDHYGHHIGDCLLKEVTKQLKFCLREYDFIARLGGDEFAIIIDDIKKPEDAGNIAQKIIDLTFHQYHIDTHTFTIGCSIGIACYPLCGDSPEILIQNADVAMYHAKNLGRNNYQYFTPELFEKSSRQDILKNDLKLAFEKNDLFFIYEPIYNIVTKTPIGMQALLRWQHPKFGLILPEQFIPLTEEIGISTALDHWALGIACEQGEKWCEAGYNHLKLSINISPLLLLDEDFPKLIENILDKTKFPRHQLGLEFQLRDPILMSGQIIAEENIKVLVNMGIEIIVNDFGIGFSSLTNLKRLPISCLKINKIFLADMLTNSNNAMIVKSMINLAKDLNINVIAEGIDTEAQLLFLIANKCQQGQGPYLSKSLTVEKITEFLHDHF